MHIKNTIISELEWEIRLTNDKSLDISQVTTVKEELGELWYSWDSNPEDNTYRVYNYEDDILPSTIHPFKVFKILIREITTLINSSGTHFFYFTPSTNRKASFYNNILPKFVSMLDGDWKYQVINNNWFYFYKD